MLPHRWPCIRFITLIVLRCLPIIQPDANGMFPIHLACSGTSDGLSHETHDKRRLDMEDLNRLDCVRQLLEKVPLTMRSGQKQTVLHAAARGGHCRLLTYLLTLWKADDRITGEKYGCKMDWQDHWFRTP